MVDVAVSSQLQQWTFGKSSRPERSASSASSPDLSHHEPETLRIDASVANAIKVNQDVDPKDFQDRYLSSEEDLSPTDGNSSDSEYESDASIHEVKKEVLSARGLSVSRWDKGLSCDLAVSVSYVSAGRPKVIELNTFASPAQEKTQRPASLAQLPIAAIEKLRKQDQQTRHRSMLLPSASASTTRSTSPALTTASRRHSLKRTAFSHNNAFHAQLFESTPSFQTASSVRSVSPAGSEYSVASRPTSAATSKSQRLPPRASSYLSSNALHASPFPPLTPLSPGPHSFLNSDPFESSTTNAASPIIKNAGTHRRLRSISQKLSLAKIAITPSTKKWDSRLNGKTGSVPLTPATPYSPRSPMTAPATTDTSPMKKLRRNSRILLSRPPTRGATTPDLPTISTTTLNSATLQRSATERMVARGANERTPTSSLLSFLEDDSPLDSVKTRPLRKRKSLMDLL